MMVKNTYNTTIPQQDIAYIGAEIGQCAGVDGCQHAPEAFIQAVEAIDDKMYITVTSQNIDRQENALPHLAEFSYSLATAVDMTLSQGSFPIIIGGDHSCGIGTWSGVAMHFHNKSEKSDENATDLGVLWIDAHLDLHTLETSDSKNMHGMPMATLLGQGDTTLTSILHPITKVKPENAFFIGIRSFESAEQKLAEKLGIKIYYMDEVQERGFGTCLNEVISYFQNKEIPFGISFDLDVIDESEVSAVGTPTSNGILSKDAISALTSQDFTGIQALEFVEYNPTLDETQDTFNVAKKILSCFDSDIK